jgi:hypothetical protein
VVEVVMTENEQRAAVRKLVEIIKELRESPIVVRREEDGTQITRSRIFNEQAKRFMEDHQIDFPAYYWLVDRAHEVLKAEGYRYE